MPVVATAELPKYQMLDLGTLGGNYSGGNAINEAGQVTGVASTADGKTHAFLATPISSLFADLLADSAVAGPDSKLAKKISLAQTYYDADDLQATCSQLTDFDSQVLKLIPKKADQVPHGPKITRQQADDRIGQSTAIMEAVGCP